MAWDEWERLKAQAAGQHPTRLRIDGLSEENGPADPPGGGGAGTLRHRSGPWTRAAGTAGDLRTGTITARTDLRRSHEGTADGLTGLVSLGALKSVLTSWDERLGRVRDECGSLEPKLRQVAVILGEVDAEVGNSAESVTVPGTRRGE
ncbi:amino acid ABC transporter permease [Streptomyces sp. NPDC015184]|uniref:amino acid ABC transporter permease n=1 Tax=Streptomyces sp. NPDC015184 TaxID=3364946 RepID=UPI0037009E62